MRNPKVLILLSDIQIGQFGRIGKKDRQKQISFTKGLVSHVTSFYDNMPGINPTYSIFALGDLASSSHPEEYKIVSEELKRMAILLKVKRRNIYLCPGNHDYSLEMCKEQSLRNRRFQAYASFQNEFYLMYNQWLIAKSHRENHHLCYALHQ